MSPITVSCRVDRDPWKLIGGFGGASDMSSGSGVKTVPFPTLTVSKKIADAWTRPARRAASGTGPLGSNLTSHAG